MRQPKKDHAAPKQKQSAVEYIWEQRGCMQQRREPIVRCRDCKFCHKNYCEKLTSPTVSPSEIFWIPVEPDGFCAWGVRREP